MGNAITGLLGQGLRNLAKAAIKGYPRLTDEAKLGIDAARQQVAAPEPEAPPRRWRRRSGDDLVELAAQSQVAEPSPTKRRGRPPRQVEQAAVVEAPAPAAPRPDRPQKPATLSPAPIAAAPAAEAIVEPTRRRGRQPKAVVPAPAQDVSVVAAEAPAQPVRRRGRPPRQAATGPEQQPLPSEPSAVPE
jgi:hypothetical protein